MSRDVTFFEDDEPYFKKAETEGEIQRFFSKISSPEKLADLIPYPSDLWEYFWELNPPLISNSAPAILSPPNSTFIPNISPPVNPQNPPQISKQPLSNLISPIGSNLSPTLSSAPNLISYSDFQTQLLSIQPQSDLSSILCHDLSPSHRHSDSLGVQILFLSSHQQAEEAGGGQTQQQLNVYSCKNFKKEVHQNFNADIPQSNNSPKVLDHGQSFESIFEIQKIQIEDLDVSIMLRKGVRSSQHILSPTLSNMIICQIQFSR